MEVQDLNKNLFLFKFSSQRDLELTLKSGPWSFDRNLLILEKVDGAEQPSEMAMHKVSFWTPDLYMPLKLRSEATARKIGKTIGVFEEMDKLDNHRIGKFMCIKVSLDLRNPLKTGIIINFQGRDIWVDFKYERSPNFCFACGRIGHQLKECDEAEDKDDGRYEDLDAKDQSYGPWLRASPLPKQVLDFKCESSSGTCSRNLFISTSNSKCRNSEREKKDEEEVNQAVKGVEMVVKKTRIEIKNPVVNKEQNIKDIEGVTESLDTVAISTTFDVGVKGRNQKSISGGT